MHSGVVTNCRMCTSTNLIKFLDLGSMPPADQFLSHADDFEVSFPLEVMSCLDCGLAQLSYVVPGDVLYCNNYPYDASTAFTARKHWSKFASSVWHKLDRKNGDLVVDIGSNVGVLLQAFKENGAQVIGVDPAENITKIANANGINTITGFFDESIASKIVKITDIRAHIITATNVFAHVDDLTSFMNAINILLADDGTFIIEAPWFVHLIQKFLYDTIYHEHLSYLSVKPMVKFFSKFNMEIYNVEEQDFHGGSIRFFVRRRNISNSPISDSVEDFLELEEQAGIYDQRVLARFAQDVECNRIELKNIIAELKNQGKSIAIVSAPAKGMTILNYCGLDHNCIDFVTEKAPLKIGKFTPGTHIPVVPDSVLLDLQPDYAILLAWNFADEIMKNLQDYKGQFLVPIPVPRMISLCM